MKILKILLLFVTIGYLNCCIDYGNENYESVYAFVVLNRTTSEIKINYSYNKSHNLAKDEAAVFLQKRFDYYYEMSENELKSLVGYIKVFKNDSLKYIQDPINLDLWELEYMRKEDEGISYLSYYRFYITDSLLANNN